MTWPKCTVCQIACSGFIYFDFVKLRSDQFICLNCCNEILEFWQVRVTKQQVEKHSKEIFNIIEQRKTEITKFIQPN